MELVLKGAQSALTVSGTTFDRDSNEALVHQVVVIYAAGTRRDICARKTCAEVTSSGREPRHQKSTGRARSGSVRGPIWCPGGVTSVARPQDHSQKVNKKMYHGVLKDILSELVCQDRLIVVEKFSVEVLKTRPLVQELKDMALEGVLTITGELDENLLLAAHNLHKVGAHGVTGTDPVNLITFDEVVITADAVRQVEEILA